MPVNSNISHTGKEDCLEVIPVIAGHCGYCRVAPDRGIPAIWMIIKHVDMGEAPDINM